MTQHLAFVLRHLAWPVLLLSVRMASHECEHPSLILGLSTVNRGLEHKLQAGLWYFSLFIMTQTKLLLT